MRQIVALCGNGLISVSWRRLEYPLPVHGPFILLLAVRRGNILCLAKANCCFYQHAYLSVVCNALLTSLVAFYWKKQSPTSRNP